MIVSPSLASANLLCLQDEVRRAEAAGCKELHMDIEDGCFVPNITFGLKTLCAVRGITKLPFSVHLMMQNPLEWVPQLEGLGVETLFAHWEALPYPMRFLQAAGRVSRQCGIALNPRTNPQELLGIAQRLDAVLLLTSEPDGAGETFLPWVAPRAARLGQENPGLALWADGGIGPAHLPQLAAAGVSHAVQGRAFFTS